MDAEDHRCGKCGRRSVDDGIASFRRPSANLQATALAIQEPEVLVDSEISLPKPLLHIASASDGMAAHSVPSATEDPRSFQTSLFGPQEVRRSLRSAATYSPASRRQIDQNLQESLLDQHGVDSVSYHSTGSWDHSRTAVSTRSILHGDAPVALSTHRMLAAALDSSLVLIATAVVLLSCYFVAPQVEITKSMLMVSGILLLLVAIFYRLIFCFGDTDTLGSHWAGIRVLTFNGGTPTRNQRLTRIVSSAVSLISIGIGFLWALVDEEQLAWHDHMSGTFPSPRSFSEQ